MLMNLLIGIMIGNMVIFNKWETKKRSGVRRIFMKKLLFIVATSLNVLTLSLITTLSFIRYQIDTVDGNFCVSVNEYIPYSLIVIVVISFFIELFVILKK